MGLFAAGDATLTSTRCQTEPQNRVVRLAWLSAEPIRATISQRWLKLTDEKSGIPTNANISDISQQGCFVETGSPLSLGTETTLRISKGTDAFEARARVVHLGTNGMGLLFTAVVQEQLPDP